MFSYIVTVYTHTQHVEKYHLMKHSNCLISYYDGMWMNGEWIKSFKLEGKAVDKENFI